MTLQSVPGGSFGRNLDFILVDKNGYLNKNGNTVQHAIFQARHLFQDMTMDYTGGVSMNLTNTNIGGYQVSLGRTYVNTEVYTGLLGSGVPVNNSNVILPLNRHVDVGTNSGSTPSVIADVVFLPTEYEIRGSRSHSPGHETIASQAHFIYYNNDNSRIKRGRTGSGHRWWTASTSINPNAFCNITPGGVVGSGNADADIGTPPCFAIG